MAVHEGVALRRELGFWHLLVFGIVYISPIAGFTMFGFVNFYSGGAVVPAYIIAAIALGLTAISYGTMAEVEPSAGSAFAYASRAMGPLGGFVAGWALLLDYILIGALVALYAAIYLNAAFPQLSVEVYLAGFLGFALFVNVMGIRWSLTAELVIAGIQFVFCAVFAVMAVKVLLAEPGPAASVSPPDVPFGTIVTGASVAVITYLGFDAVLTLTEEVREGNPGRTAGRAALVAVIVMMGVFVLLASLLSGLGHGLDFPDPSTSAWVVVNSRIPALAWSLSLVAGLASGIGGTTTIHVGVTRLIMAMAREGHMPPSLASVHPRSRVPLVATVASMAVISGVAFVALPQVELLGGLVSFGALLAFLMVNLSVVVHFGIMRRSRRWIIHWVMPALGAIVVGYVPMGIKPTTLQVGIGWLAAGLVLYISIRAIRRTRAES